MVGLNVKVKIGKEQQDLLKRLTRAEMRAFLHLMGPELADQVKRNIISAGSVGSDKWEPLTPEYAKRKKAGKTEGHGRHGYAMLRDTGSMFDNITGVVVETNKGIGLGVTSEGKGRNRDVSNAELLMMHAEGAGDLPERDPTFDMRAFERRFQAALERFLSGGTGFRR